MKAFNYVITDHEGIHARPAGLFVKLAGQFESKVTIAKGDKTGDAKRIFAVMSLGAKKGETVDVTCEGPDEEEAAKALEAFLKENL